MRLLLPLSFALGLLTACGADLGEPCTSDDDCAGDLICHEHEDGDAVCEDPDEHEHEHDTGAE
ncbi:MAG: hypothetical protein H6741_10555 [Alphaproteobacteria bacterium]|nr:hypothetical protein [Alphaproteobacteria bacterium]